MGRQCLTSRCKCSLQATEEVAIGLTSWHRFPRENPAVKSPTHPARPMSHRKTRCEQHGGYRNDAQRRDEAQIWQNDLPVERRKQLRSLELRLVSHIPMRMLPLLLQPHLLWTALGLVPAAIDVLVLGPIHRRLRVAIEGRHGDIGRGCVSRRAPDAYVFAAVRLTRVRPDPTPMLGTLLTIVVARRVGVAPGHWRLVVLRRYILAALLRRLRL
mmetsp:Transcript_1182/g.2574  ORF Transcript_1182/g.2574 Transcript_1182/m.2574 type:complete len:214 (-) Transcript_1182:908-1549(-)